jgi:hypothetical protein
MGTYMCKLVDPRDGVEVYFDWSTVTDAPQTSGMSLEQYKAWYRRQWDAGHIATDFESRLRRVEAKGTSSLIDASITEVIANNHAGPGGSHLDLIPLLDLLRSEDDAP